MRTVSLAAVACLLAAAACSFESDFGSRWNHDQKNPASLEANATALPGDVLTQRSDSGRTGATSYQGLNA